MSSSKNSSTGNRGAIDDVAASSTKPKPRISKRNRGAPRTPGGTGTRSNPPSRVSAKWRSRSGIDGPGIWVTCVRGKERQTVGELYDLFESLAAELWPENHAESADDGDEGDEELSIEAQLAKEVAGLRQPRSRHRFVNCQTKTNCVIFIACKPPVDPVKLVVTHINNVLRTGIKGTRYTQRLVPSSGTSQATIPEIHGLCHQVFPSFFDRSPERKYSYKVELTVRNHTTLSRPTIIQEIARCMPEGHTVNLENPQVFILVEIFKNVCGISVVEDYYTLLKFNVTEIANAKIVQSGDGRVSSKKRCFGDSQISRAEI